MPMRHLLPTIFATWLLFLTSPATAQGPSGSVDFSGPGVAQLSTSQFVPVSYQGADGSWSFFSEEDQIAIIVLESTVDPTGAAFVSVAESGGGTWADLSFTALPGISIEGDTLVFSDVTLSGDAEEGTEDLTLNGSLTRPSSVETPTMSWGRTKSGFRP